MAKQARLFPCVFCESREIELRQKGGAKKKTWVAVCAGCGETIEFFRRAQSEEEARDLWNYGRICKKTTQKRTQKTCR